MNSKPALRDFGPAGLPLYLLSRLMSRLPGRRARLVKYVYWAQPVPEKRLLPDRPGAPAIRRLLPGDPELGQIPRDASVVERRFASGDCCLGIVKNGRLAGYMWLALGPYEEDEVRCRYEPRPAQHAAWDYDIFLQPDERGGLLFVRLWDAAYALLRAQGYRWTLSRISSFNLASSASQARMGAHRVGWGVFVVLFGCQLMVSSIAPFLHLALPRGRRPVLQLDAEASRPGPGEPAVTHRAGLW
jgi:hypothetical protein